MTPAGARANGRAGSEFASGDSAMSLFYNPAGLALVNAPATIDGAFHLHFNRRCYEGFEVDESTSPASTSSTYPEICGDTGLTLLPELAATVRLRDDLVLGLGVYVPTAGARHITFGNVDTGEFDSDGSGPAAAIPSPSRYQLMESELLQLFLTAGVGWAPHPRFRVGGSFGWGITKISFSNAAYARADVVSGVITAYSDARSALDGLDAFVPRLSLGVSGEPSTRVPLTFGASFQWTGDVRTESATLAVHGLSMRIEPQWIGDLVGELDVDALVKGVGVRVPQTGQLAFGVRYADRLDQPADGLGDRLSNERFDVELGVALLLAKGVDAFRVDLPDDAEVVVPSPLPAILPDQQIALPDEIRLDHRWQNQVALSAGGDVNPIPGVLGIRGGIRYETSGVRHGYQQVDFTPFRNVSFHLGSTVRVASRLDLSLAFAHVIYPDVTVGPTEARVRRIVSGDSDPNDPAEATLANAGIYRNRLTSLMLEANVRLGRLGR